MKDAVSQVGRLVGWAIGWAVEGAVAKDAVLVGRLGGGHTTFRQLASATFQITIIS